MMGSDGNARLAKRQQAHGAADPGAMSELTFHISTDLLEGEKSEDQRHP